ncbi:hypothetical protein C8J37_12322 [Rhizobium sp. PP-WC-1G-195]|nr:hypothetical protein C8J37_12322 [Rhizobium sp. PP-WC-1G-195]
MSIFVSLTLRNYNAASIRTSDVPVGHAGFIQVNDAGIATYYEYGRYNPATQKGLITNNPNGPTEGNIRSVPLGQLEIGPDGKITAISMKAALDTVFGTSGIYTKDVGAVSVAQFKTNSLQNQKISNFIADAKSKVNAGTLSYSLAGVNCLRFTYNAALAGDTNINPSQNPNDFAVPSLAAERILQTANGGYLYFGPKSAQEGGLYGSSDINGRIKLAKDAFWQGYQALKSWSLNDIANAVISHVYDASGTPTALNVNRPSGTLFQQVSLYDGYKTRLTQFNPAGVRVMDTLLDPGAAVGTGANGKLDSGFIKASYYGSTGQRVFVRTAWSDGTKTRVAFDNENQESWADKTTNYNSSGQAIYVRTMHDDGTKTVVKYDDGNESWKRITSAYNSDGQKLRELSVFDDGSRRFSTYEPSTGQVRTSTTYNSAGQVTGGLGSSGGFNGAFGGNGDGDGNGSNTGYNSTSDWGGCGFTDSQGVTHLCEIRATPDGNYPVMLDLNMDGSLDLRQLPEIDPAGIEGPVFDWDGDGLANVTAWAGPQDGWLAIDLSATGAAGADSTISQAQELSFSSWASPAQTGGDQVSDMEGLRLVFDTNHNDLLDTGDERWSEFRIWQDANQNGISDAGELRTLEQADIRLIELVPSSDGQRQFADGSKILGTSSFVKTDGSYGLAGDVMVAYRHGNLNS